MPSFTGSTPAPLRGHLLDRRWWIARGKGLHGNSLTAQLALFSTIAAAYVHHQSTVRARDHSARPATFAHPRIPLAAKSPRPDRYSARRGQYRHLTSLATESGSHDQVDAPPPSSSARPSGQAGDIDDINALMRHPSLLKDIKVPRNPIVLCHGLYGFDVRGPFWGLEIHYWASVLDILRKKVGAEVIVRGVPGTGSIADRAWALHKYLCSDEAGVRGKRLNFVGHSMGGLDARYLISVIKPQEYTPVSLTSLSTPNRGSPFMDWCNANIGTGQERVEEEIRKAKDKLKAKSSAAEGWLNSGAKAPVSDKEEFEKDEIRNPPFSLKTPLFVRPDSPSNKDKGPVAAKQDEEASSEPILEKAQTIATGVAAGIVQMATTPTQLLTSSSGPSVNTEAQKNDDGKQKKAKKNGNGGSSLLDFTAFSRALSSLGGSFSSYMLSVLDQPAYAMLSTRYMAQVFNPTVPDSPNVAYFSVAARKRSLPIYHPLWLPKLVLDSAAESRSAGGERDGSADALGGKSQGNDGLVSVESAKWGKFLGTVEGCDHWDLRGGGAPRWKGNVNPQTGKPLSRQEGGAGSDAAESKDHSSGWSDINRIVKKLFSASAKQVDKKKEISATKEEHDGRDGTKAAQVEDDKKHSSWRDAITSILPGSDPKKGDVQEGLVDEVASWISDRLPKGDEGRRAQAEQAADKHDQERLAVRGASHGAAPSDNNGGGGDAKAIRSTAPNELDVIKTSVKLRREAAWQEELGHMDAARDLRRELAWHRSEWDRASSTSNGNSSAATSSERSPRRSDSWDSSTSKRSSSESNHASPGSSAAELERFWVAVCRHLWARGF